MNVIRCLIRIPFVNIIMFSCFPYVSYREYLLWVLEENGVSIEQFWSKLTDEEKVKMEQAGLGEKELEKISGNNKENEDARESPASSQQ